MTSEGVGVAVTGDQGACDAAHLPAELEVILAGAEAIGVGKGEIDQANEERGKKETGCGVLPGGAEEAFYLGEHCPNCRQG